MLFRYFSFSTRTICPFFTAHRSTRMMRNQVQLICMAHVISRTACLTGVDGLLLQDLLGRRRAIGCRGGGGGRLRFAGRLCGGLDTGSRTPPDQRRRRGPVCGRCCAGEESQPGRGGGEGFHGWLAGRDVRNAGSHEKLHRGRIRWLSGSGLPSTYALLGRPVTPGPFRKHVPGPSILPPSILQKKKKKLQSRVRYYCTTASGCASGAACT